MILAAVIIAIIITAGWMFCVYAADAFRAEKKDWRHNYEQRSDRR